VGQRGLGRSDGVPPPILSPAMTPRMDTEGVAWLIPYCARPLSIIKLLFHVRCVRGSERHHRRSGGPTEALPEWKAGTDHRTAIVRSRGYPPCG